MACDPIDENYESFNTGHEESRGEYHEILRAPMFKGNIRILEKSKAKEAVADKRSPPPLKRRAITPMRRKELAAEKVS